MRRSSLALLLLLAALGPAEAHKLKVFAAVEGNSIRGYAFFIGGGRAEQTPWVAKDANGAELGTGKTDDDGRFALGLSGTPTSGVTITVDTHEGHIASATLPASRFGAGPPGDTTGAIAAAPAATPSAAATAPMAEDPRLPALVEAAVQRQVEPLMEQIDQMDSRLRFSDIVSGVFLILGLAGMASWVLGRRRK